MSRGYPDVWRAASENTGSSVRVMLDRKSEGSFRRSKGSGGRQNRETQTSTIEMDLTERKHTPELVFSTAMNINRFKLVEIVEE